MRIALCPITRESYHFSLELLMAVWLRHRGHEVIIYLAGDVNVHSDKIFDTHHGRPKKMTLFRRILWKSVAKLCGVELNIIDRISTGVGETDRTENITDSIRSSIIRCFQDENVERHLDTDRALRIIRQTKELEDFFSREFAERKPSVLVSSHGIYSTWAPAWDCAGKRGVSRICYGRNVYDQVLPFKFSDTIFQNIEESDFFQRELKKGNSIFLKKGQSLLDYRLAGTEKKITDGFGFDNSLDLPEMELFRGTNIVVVFPNLIWDGNVPQRNTIFGSFEEWLRYTINVVLEDDKMSLILRYHPAETKLHKETRQLCEIIRGWPEYDEVSASGRFLEIPSSSAMNSIELAKRCNRAVTYDGVLSVELPYADVPTISCGRGRFSQDGWNHIPESYEDYKRLLQTEELSTKKGGGRRVSFFWGWYNGAAVLPFQKSYENIWFARVKLCGFVLFIIRQRYRPNEMSKQFYGILNSLIAS